MRSLLPVFFIATKGSFSFTPPLQVEREQLYRFFDTRIPKYKFAYNVAQAPDGKYKVSCRIEQSSVADDFQMVIPLYVDFGDKKFVRLRAVVKGPLSQFDLPMLPMKPEKIIFNDMESVLCEVEYADWK